MPGKEVKAAPKAAAKAAAPYKAAAADKVRGDNKMASKFVARPKDFGVGRDTPYKRDISRFMRWPVFVTLQRKKRVLQRRMKVPPALNQFRQTLDKTTRTELFKLLKKYKPETRSERNARLKAAAEAKAKDTKKAVVTKAPVSLVTGLREVTRAIEKKQAKLVVIANDVDPIELVLWIPTLCRAQKVAYAIVKDKARLGELVGRRTAAVVAVSEVNSEDVNALKAVTKSINARFAARADTLRKKWGGLQMSMRSVARLRKRSSEQAAAAKQD